MSIVRRKEIAMLFYIAPMLFIVFEYYTGVGSNAASALITWGIILSTFTYLIGGFAIFRHHILKIANKNNDWPYSAILMATFASFLGMAYLHQPGYQWVLENVYQPLTILMFGFVGFYTVTALFRGSRVRNLHAGVLITCAILLMLYNAPVGEAIWPGFQTLGGWLKDVPNTGVMRGVVIGVAIGVLATFVRSLLGLETSYLGGD
jgi:hypothetical protein